MTTKLVQSVKENVLSLQRKNHSMAASSVKGGIMIACGKAIGRSANRGGLIKRIVRQRERDLLLSLDRHDTECGLAPV